MPNKGGDGWFSTDEREFFRALASECIEHTLTRIGFRDGPAHRGGVGTDWKNTSWEEDGVEIREWNIVPPHPLRNKGMYLNYRRDYQGGGSVVPDEIEPVIPVLPSRG